MESVKFIFYIVITILFCFSIVCKYFEIAKNRSEAKFWFEMKDSLFKKTATINFNPVVNISEKKS